MSEVPTRVQSNCPKCGGRTYADNDSIRGISNRCIDCGLFYALGSLKESLKKQILVDLYVNPIRSIERVTEV